MGGSNLFRARSIFRSGGRVLGRSKRGIAYRYEPLVNAPDAVPQMRLLRTGVAVPRLGLDCAGVSHEKVRAGVAEALRLGYRHFACGDGEDGQSAVGAALSDWHQARGVITEVFVTVDLPSTAWGDVSASANASLERLQGAPVGMLYLNWPAKPGPDGVHSIAQHEEIMDAWRQMEALVGGRKMAYKPRRFSKVHHIGVSHFGFQNVNLILRDCQVAPDAHKYEMHPLLQQRKMLQQCLDTEIRPVGLLPFGAAEADALSSPTVEVASKARSEPPEATCLRWVMGRQSFVLAPLAMAEEGDLEDWYRYCSNGDESVMIRDHVRRMATADKMQRTITGQHIRQGTHWQETLWVA